MSHNQLTTRWESWKPPKYWVLRRKSFKSSGLVSPETSRCSSVVEKSNNQSGLIMLRKPLLIRQKDKILIYDNSEKTVPYKCWSLFCYLCVHSEESHVVNIVNFIFIRNSLNTPAWKQLMCNNLSHYILVNRKCQVQISHITLSNTFVLLISFLITLPFVYSLPQNVL